MTEGRELTQEMFTRDYRNLRFKYKHTKGTLRLVWLSLNDGRSWLSDERQTIV